MQTQCSNTYSPSRASCSTIFPAELVPELRSELLMIVTCCFIIYLSLGIPLPRKKSMNKILDHLSADTKLLLGSIKVLLNPGSTQMLVRQLHLLGCDVVQTGDSRYPFEVRIPKDYQMGDFILLFEVVNKHQQITVRKRKCLLYIDIE